MQKFQDVLDGKATLEGFTSEELVDFNKYAVEAAKVEVDKVSGLREAKRVENDRVVNAKAEADRLEAAAKAEREKNQPQTPEMRQFREEQILKAKNKLFSTVELTDEQKVVVEEKFKRLDSGKIDSDLIYEDFLSSVAAANPQKYMSLSEKQRESERAAALELERQAAAGGAPPTGEQKKKFSDEALALASQAGITPEAAQKQTQEGMRRTY